MKWKFPPALASDQAIGVVAPSSFVDNTFLQSGQKKCSQLGLKLHYDESILQKKLFFAGEDSQRAENFIAAHTSETNNMLWCARGGYGAARILPLLEEKKFHTTLQENPKLLIGYSDSTALFTYYLQRGGVSCLHAPLMAAPSWLDTTEKDSTDFLNILHGTTGLGKASHTAKWNTLFLGNRGTAEGILMGGNISVLCSLVGTPWQPKFQGGIVLLEDCNEPPYRLHRMLTQLDQAGCFDGIRGVILGDCTHGVPKGTTWETVFSDILVPKCLVLHGAPVGHSKRNSPLPLGVRARINSQGKLELLEQVVGL